MSKPNTGCAIFFSIQIFFPSRPCEKACKKYEKNIAKGAKENQKNFWKYVQQQSKTNTGVQVLKNADGTQSNSDELEANTVKTS